MPFSNFAEKERLLEMRDSRLGDLIGYCERLLPEFVQSQTDREQLSWMSEAVGEWKQDCELPPGCKLIRFDAWLSSPEHRGQLGRFFGFVGETIRKNMPATEAIIATESERVQNFILQAA
jgi:hypothetical protein